MIPNKSEINKLMLKYAPNVNEYELIKTHGEIVAEIALWCVKNSKKDVDIEILEIACLLHDIGSFPFLAAHRHSEDYKESYPQHAILGAKILQDEGIDDRIWQAVETHVLMGLTAKEIEETGKKLPYKNYEPRTAEARLLCYADRFHSKAPVFNSFDSFYSNLMKDLPDQANKMLVSSEEFGIPDIEALAKKYGHPIR